MDEVYLKEALKLARIRRGFCAPNPSVGAVVVRNDEIISRGYHRGPGSPHAEVEALQGLDSAEGTTLYVTLEPCCHWGRTPPCTELVIKKKVRRVVFGFRDPNPQVAGKGNNLLTQAGVECSHIRLESVDEFYRSYQFWWDHKRPFVTAKLALTLDGKIAGAGGTPAKITGKNSEQFTHERRMHTDAILTTRRTLERDDPRLNARLEGRIYAKPVYVLDSSLKLRSNARIFETAAQVTLFHRADVAGGDIHSFDPAKVFRKSVSSQEENLSWEEILGQVGEEGIHDLWVEAGGKCFQSLAIGGWLGRAFLYVAPKWLGPAAQNAFDGSPDLFGRTREVRWSSLGEDSLCELVW